MIAPTDQDREVARQIVALVLSEHEAAWESVAQIIAAHRNAKCHYCGGTGTVPGPVMEVYDCPVCHPTTTTSGVNLDKSE